MIVVLLPCGIAGLHVLQNHFREYDRPSQTNHGQGRPPKIDRKILNKARHWCEERAFTPVELHDKLEEMSGKNLGISQIRRYAREWGYSRKKTQPIMVSRTPMEEVNMESRPVSKDCKIHKDGIYNCNTR